MDTKLNLSPHYLKPGLLLVVLVFGDLRAILHESKIRDVDMTVIGSILESNKRQIGRVVNILHKYKGKIRFIGLSFKVVPMISGESHSEVVETLLGKGFDIKFMTGLSRWLVLSVQTRTI